MADTTNTNHAVVNSNLNLNDKADAKEPTMTNVAPCNKLVHYIYHDGRKVAKLPFIKGRDSNFVPDVRFNPEYETSTLFELLGVPYGEFSVFGTKSSTLDGALIEYDKLGHRGWRNKVINDNKAFRVIYGDYDDHGVGIMVPFETGIKSLKDVGVNLILRSKKDKKKARKYFRRFRSFHRWASLGDVAGMFVVPEGTVIRIKVHTLEFDVLFVDIDKMAKENKMLMDGVMYTNINLLHSLGEVLDNRELKRMKVGDLFMGTLANPAGFGKGFSHVVDMQKYGVIVYGPKKQLTFDRFFFGSMGAVNGGDATTCIQSLSCFISEKTRDMWQELALLRINELIDALHDESKLRRMLSANLPSMAEMMAEDNPSPFIFAMAMRLGVPILKTPGLFRRAVGFLAAKVMDYMKARIPLGEIGFRAHLMPDPYCVDFETGEVDWTKSRIPADAVCCMDAPDGQEIAFYHQPLGNAKQACVSRNTIKPCYRKFVGRHRIILGRDAWKQHTIMGETDNDDSVVVITNSSWVDMIKAAEYPVTPMDFSDESASEKDDANPFLHGQTVKFNGRTIHIPGVKPESYPRNWTIDPDYFDASKEATQAQLTIGQIDNAGRLDNLLSGDNKLNMLSDLSRRIETEKDPVELDKLKEAFLNLCDREDYQAKEVMSNLDDFVDAVKMAKGNDAAIAASGHKLESIARDTKVFPECWTYLGRGENGRIPYERRMAGDYTLAPSLVCETLGAIKKMREQALDALREEEWLIADRIPMELNETFIRDEDVRNIVTEIRTAWFTWWQIVQSGECEEELSRAYKIILNGGVLHIKPNHTEVKIDGLRTMINEYKGEDINDRRLDIAVEIARRVYRTRYTEAQLDDSGNRRVFPDGILWNEVVAPFYLKAMELAGLTGLYLPVKFDRHSRNLKEGAIEVRVEMDMTVVRNHDNFVIGEVPELIKPGVYTMTHGILCVLEASPSLTENLTTVDEANFDDAYAPEVLVG